MKIALCLSGLATKTLNGIKIIDAYKHAHAYFQKELLSKYDVDVFIHNWEPELESELVNLYKPKLYIIEPQIDFYPLHKSLDINEVHRMLGNNNIERLPNIYSMLYSRKTSIQLMNSYSKSNKIPYDWIILTRNDYAIGSEYELFFNPQNDNHFIYCIKFEQNNAGPQDRYFHMNYENSLIIGSLFDYLPKYLSVKSEYMTALENGFPVSSPDRLSCELYKPENERSKILEKIDLKYAWNAHCLYKWHLYKHNKWSMTYIKELPKVRIQSMSIIPSLIPSNGVPRFI